MKSGHVRKSIDLKDIYEIIVFNDSLHFLDSLQVAEHVSINESGFKQQQEAFFERFGTHPTEHTAPDSLMALATFKERSTGPVATGFSTNKATPGKYLISFNSISAPGKSDPR